MIDVSFYWFLQSLTSYPVQQDRIDASQLATPRVWFQRQSQTTEVFVNGTPGQTDTVFDVEVCGEDIDAVQNLANTLRTSLNGYSGIMLFDRVLGTFVNEANDEYIFKNFDADDGFHVAAFQVQVIS